MLQLLKEWMFFVDAFFFPMMNSGEELVMIQQVTLIRESVQTEYKTVLLALMKNSFSCLCVSPHKFMAGNPHIR